MISILFAGDFCCRPSTKAVEASDEIKELLSGRDCNIINFEVPLRPEGLELPKIPRFRFYQNDDAPDFLRGLGFNLFQQANNHAFDWGVDGFRKTREALGNQTFGAGTYDEAYRVKVVEKNGKKIGFMALSYAADMGVFDNSMNHEGIGCAYVDDLRVGHDIIKAKENVDYLFILPHDGVEYIDIPMPSTIARYHDFIDYGADGVIATHPHCPQGWEVYKGKPIFYSLGNFFFNSKSEYDFKATNPHWYEGLCVVFNIDDGKISFEVINTRNIDNVKIVVDHDSARDSHNAKLCQYLKDKDAYLKYMSVVCNTVGKKEVAIIGSSFLHDFSLKQSMKIFIRALKNKILRRSPQRDNHNLHALLKNQTRCELLRESLLKQHK